MIIKSIESKPSLKPELKPELINHVYKPSMYVYKPSMTMCISIRSVNV